MKSLVVVGAGPKGMALAAKASVLRDHGFPVPHVHVVERQEVGAHWSGKHGYTDGRQALGTPPEKDIGFPYQSEFWGNANGSINASMQRFSWGAFLASEREYDDWVDRGRPSPCHGKWAAYLRWVWGQVGDGVTLHQGEVRRVQRRAGRWVCEVGAKEPLLADGIVMTGPAKVRLPSRLPVHSQVFTIESFWLRFEEFKNRQGTVLLVGTGENAAVAASALIDNPGLKVQVLSPSGVVFSRGEGYTENRVYSRPETVGWAQLSEPDRREFIRRTDRGVFSVAALKALADRPPFEVIPGRLQKVEAKQSRLEVGYAYGGNLHRLEVDALVLATGSDMSGALREMFSLSPQEMPDTDRELERQIGESLEVKALTPRLHLPMLSGLNQGPGFSNLSCLGKLSDRILYPYVEESGREQNSRLVGT